MQTVDNYSILIVTTSCTDKMKRNCVTGVYVAKFEYIMDDYGNIVPLCIHLTNQNVFSLDLNSAVCGQYWTT